MKTAPGIHLNDVQAVYSGAEARLWELLMGEQIHIGGFQSSLDLAQRAGLREGQAGVDFCCATGAGMRFLVRFRGIGHMTGVDATPAMLNLGRRRCVEEGMGERVTFVEADVSDSRLPDERFDFAWGEDAWCYVEHKPRLIAEAARVIRPRGVIAFTDWMEGPVALGSEEAGRLLEFMKFPSILSLNEYAEVVRSQGCRVELARDTGRFVPYCALYLEMIEKQLTYDALKIIGFDTAQAETLVNEMRFLLALAQAGKIVQGQIVAHKA